MNHISNRRKMRGQILRNADDVDEDCMLHPLKHQSLKLDKLESERKRRVYWFDLNYEDPKSLYCGVYLGFRPRTLHYEDMLMSL